MTSTKGLTDKDFKRFADFLIKANNEQLNYMKSAILDEQLKRLRGF